VEARNRSDNGRCMMDRIAEIEARVAKATESRATEVPAVGIEFELVYEDIPYLLAALKAARDGEKQATAFIRLLRGDADDIAREIGTVELGEGIEFNLRTGVLPIVKRMQRAAAAALAPSPEPSAKRAGGA
jgi:hypothetical protein